MSFFKKLTKEFDNLGLGSDRKEEDRPSGGSSSQLPRH